MCIGELPSKEVELTSKDRELVALFKEHPLTYRMLRQELMRLQEAGTVIKRKAKSRRGQGTCYRRTVSQYPDLEAEPQEHQFDFGDIGIIVKQLGEIQDEDQRAMETSKRIYLGYRKLILTMFKESLLCNENPDKAQAEKRLDSVLTDYIMPLSAGLTELFPMLGKYGGKSLEVVEDITLEPIDKHDRVWIKKSMQE
jgi:hypothetical protein